MPNRDANGDFADVFDSVIDPSKLGPLGVCLVCFTPRSHDVSFCKRCGKLFGFLATDDPHQGASCAYHPASLAFTACTLCGRMICSACLEREGFSLLGGLKTPQCGNCVARMEGLAKSYNEEINHKKVCAKHPHRVTMFRCLNCRLPHCETCLYFTRNRWFRTKVGAGPFCLICFRMKTVGADRKNYISLKELRENGLGRVINPAAVL
jgi:hypothetical protein